MQTLDYFEITHIGSRKINQDYCTHRFFDNGACFVIADGLGGHIKGEVASSVFCEALMEVAPHYIPLMAEVPISAMEKWILHAGEIFREYVISREGEIDTHTTFCLLWIDDDQLVTAHVGDSRIYRLSPPHSIWRTQDHTLLQQYFDEGKVSEEAFLGHPLQNKLLKTVNIIKTPEADIYVHPPLMSNETILLCTDGFWNYLTKLDLENFSKPELTKKAIEDKVMSIIKSNPFHADNITVQMVQLK